MREEGQDRTGHDRAGQGRVGRKGQHRAWEGRGNEGRRQTDKEEDREQNLVIYQLRFNVTKVGHRIYTIGEVYYPQYLWYFRNKLKGHNEYL